ncbi:hypothetical protein C5167_050606, partial [Papaver somniferum]
VHIAGVGDWVHFIAESFSGLHAHNHPSLLTYKVSLCKTMDKSWVHKARWGKEYEDGVRLFLDHAFEKGVVTEDSKIKCPSRKCNNVNYKVRSEIFSDLILHGMMRNYTTWFHHGESLSSMVSSSIAPHDTCFEVRNNNDERPGDDLFGMLRAVCGIPMRDDEGMDDRGDGEGGRNDAFAVVMGPDRRGRVRCFGSTVKPKQFWGESSSSSKVVQIDRGKCNAQTKGCRIGGSSCSITTKSEQRRTPGNVTWKGARRVSCQILTDDTQMIK